MNMKATKYLLVSIRAHIKYKFDNLKGLARKQLYLQEIN